MGLKLKKLFKRLPGKDTKQTLLGLGGINMATGGIAGMQMASAAGSSKENRRFIMEDKLLEKAVGPMMPLNQQHEGRLEREVVDEQRRQSDLGTEADMAAQQALMEQQQEYLKQRRRKGYSSTVLTSFDKGSAPIYRKTLLGG